jgi:hypothetical protein
VRGKRAVVDKRLDLHASGATSYLLVFRDKKLEAPANPRPISDEIRIYDADGGRLRLHFKFQPKPLTDPLVKIPFPYKFRLARVGDLDQNGSREIVGAYSIVGAREVLPHPVVIAWADISQRYEIASLAPTRPHLMSAGQFPAKAYQQSVVLTDMGSAQSLRVFPVEDFDVVSRGARLPPLLIAAYVVKERSSSEPLLAQVLGLELDLTNEPPSVGECFSEPQVLVPPNTRELLVQSAVRAWRKKVGSGRC